METFKEKVPDLQQELLLFLIKKMALQNKMLEVLRNASSDNYPETIKEIADIASEDSGLCADLSDLLVKDG